MLCTSKMSAISLSDMQQTRKPKLSANEPILISLFPYCPLNEEGGLARETQLKLSLSKLAFHRVVMADSASHLPT